MSKSPLWAVIVTGSALTSLPVPALSQTITDPRQVVSVKNESFRAAPAKSISAINDFSPPSWSPDGTQVLYTSYETGISNVWVTNVKTGKSRVIAQSEHAQQWPAWSPDGKQISFQVDQAGNEVYDIFVADVATGQITNVTNTPEVAESDATWSPDGRALAFSSRAATASSARIGVIDVNSKRQKLLTTSSSTERSHLAPLWSATGTFIYFTDLAWSLTDSNVMRVRSSGGITENLTPHSGDGIHMLEDLSRDERWVLISSDVSNGWRNVAILGTEDRKVRWLTTEAANHFAGAFSSDSSIVSYVRDEPLGSQVFLFTIATGEKRQVTGGPGLHELETGRAIVPHVGSRPFSPNNAHLAYRLSKGASGSELRVLSLQDHRDRTLVANSMSDQVRAGLIDPLHVTFKSGDGKFDIPALLWMPPNLQRDGTHPAIVEIHGGPMDQTRPGLLTYIQVLATRGYIVISPNYRGSANYDRAFFVANRMDMGGGDLDDVMSAADWLVKTGYVDSKRIGAYGASNGAYLTLLALGKHPDRWAAGAALYPFVDYFTGYETELPWIQAIDRVLMGDPKQHAALWRDRSPITHAARIRTPVLMTAGANDPRCPPQQARQMEKAIRDAGGNVTLKIFGEQGHGAQQTDAYIDENTMVVEFFDHHLRR